MLTYLYLISLSCSSLCLIFPHLFCPSKISILHLPPASLPPFLLDFVHLTLSSHSWSTEWNICCNREGTEGVKAGVVDSFAAIINYHQLSGLEQHKFNPSGLEAKSPKLSYEQEGRFRERTVLATWRQWFRLSLRCGSLDLAFASYQHGQLLFHCLSPEWPLFVYNCE